MNTAADAVYKAAERPEDTDWRSAGPGVSRRSAHSECELDRVAVMDRDTPVVATCAKRYQFRRNIEPNLSERSHRPSRNWRLMTIIGPTIQSKTTVLMPLSSTRFSACAFTAEASARASKSWPSAASSDAEKR